MPKPPASRYKPHPLLELAERSKAKLAQESGKTFDAWVELGRRKGPATRQALGAWFRKQHGLGQMNAHWLALAVLSPQEDYGDPEPLVDALYSGERSALRPLHEALVDVLNGLGEEVCVTACKTMVPAYRKHVFAELRPTAQGVLLRMALGSVPMGGRLKADTQGMPGERLTHAVTVRTRKELDAELKGWLAKAYALGAGAIPRSTTFVLPADLKRAITASKPAAATWASMTPAMQRDLVQWIESAKQADTRARRQATALTKLASGKKRVY